MPISSSIRSWRRLISNNEGNVLELGQEVDIASCLVSPPSVGAEHGEATDTEPPHELGLPSTESRQDLLSLGARKGVLPRAVGSFPSPETR